MFAVCVKGLSGGRVIFQEKHVTMIREMFNTTDGLIQGLKKGVSPELLYWSAAT